MANLIVQINMEAMNSENFEIKAKNIRSYQLTSNAVSENMLNELYAIMLNKRGDWFSFDRNYFNDNYYIDINFIMMDEQLEYLDMNSFDGIIEACEHFFSENGLSSTISSYNNLDKLDKLFNQKGYLVGFHHLDCGEEIDIDELKLSLNELNLSYEVINKRQSFHEQGASSEAADLIVFIFSSVAQGMTWDLIKYSLSKAIRIPDIFSSYLENYNFKRARKIIADRVQEDSKDLILTRLEPKNGNIYIQYSTPSKIIKIEYDQGYNIKKIKVKERFTQVDS